MRGAQIISGPGRQQCGTQIQGPSTPSCMSEIALDMGQMFIHQAHGAYGIALFDCIDQRGVLIR